MALQEISYLLPEGFDLEQLKAFLKESNGFKEEAASKVMETYYDSFDWRIWQVGAELIHEQAQQNRLCWVDQKAPRSSLCQGIETPPSFAKDLPRGALAERLLSVLEMRILLPQVSIMQQRQTLSILDSEEKTVVRVVLEQNSYRSINRRQTGPLDGRIHLKPLKGYETYFEKLKQRLQELKLQHCERGLYLDALLGVGIKVGGYSSKMHLCLDPEARSDHTAKLIMSHLLDTLEANIPGARMNLDSEYLHDLRVATRRTRSAMNQIKGVFNPQELNPFKQGFSWIGSVTGPTRDLDVYLLQYETYRASLPIEVQPHLEPFHAFLLRRHKMVQAELVKKLNSPHFRKLIKSWRSWLEAPLCDKPTAPKATMPIAKLADHQIHKLYVRLLKEGSKITADSPAESMHDLRKQCKKLRYLMEFFQSLYPKSDIRKSIKALKIILDNLGEYQDLEVQARTLEAFGDEMLKEGAPASALMAMGILVGKLFEKQTEKREEFTDLFKAFSSRANQRVFHKLFGES
jgi:CHAD domain-containing protein